MKFLVSKQERVFIVVFFSLLALHIVLDNLESEWAYFTKPALLLALLIFFFNQCAHLQKQTRNIMIVALSFSLIGDILLMFVEQSPHFFTAGLAAFLLAHIMFIVVFLSRKNTQPLLYLFGAFLLVYAAGLFYLIYANLGTMLVPVVLYILVILSMAISAFIRKGRVNSISYALVLLGAIFFLMSDSILALNKFYKPILFPQVSIMLTYGLAQFLITLGILKQEH